MDGARVVWLLLFSCVVLGIAAQQDPCNGSYIEISVDSSAPSSSCTNKNGSKCNNLQYVLSNLTLMNCTRISVDSNQVINSSITLRAVDGLILQGDGASVNVTCVNQGSGFIFINCTNVEFDTIEWINCNMINFSSPVLCHPSSHGMVSEIFSRKYESPSVQQDCNSVLYWEYPSKVMLGQDILLSSYYNNDSFQFLHEPTVYAELACSLKGNKCNETYHLNGYRPPFSLSGKLKSSLTPVIMWYNATDDNSLIACMEIDISKNCNYGYVYDSDKRICSCYSTGDDDDSDPIKCNTTDGTACIKAGYWYGKIDSRACSSDKNHTCTAAYPCPFGYCDYVSSNKCPTRPCGGHKFFCELDPDTSDTLCLYNRGGTLCSSCQTNYSLSFDGMRCVDNDDCNSGSLVLYILIFLLFWASLTIVIVAVTKLNLRIGSGQLYCLVFFFSVLQYFVRGSFPSIFLYVLVLVFTGFMQLDPKMFGLFEVCLKYSNITNIHYVSLCCINPLFLMLVIGLLICVSSRCPRYALFTQKNSAVNMICIVLYLVFISLTQTSLSLLAPVRYPSKNHTYVALEPNVKYFNTKYHLSYAVFAILMQIILVIPFLFLLIFAPCLIRVGALNLTRIKPILDEYQACYKEQYRSFAGFYLASRQLIFMISLFPISTTDYIYILQILSILLLTVHCIVQPYTSLRLNIFDGLLILDLVLLSILHGSTANVVFGIGRGLELKTAFVYLLVLFPVIYFIGMCIVQFAKFTFWKNVDCNFNKSKRKIVQTRDHTKSTPVDPEDDPEKMERESLLFQSNLSYESLVVSGREEGKIEPGKVTVVEVTH